MIKISLYDRKREIDNDLSIWEHIFDLAVKKTNFHFSNEKIMNFFYGYFTNDITWEYFFKKDGFTSGKIYNADILIKDPAFIKLVQSLIEADSYSLFVIHYSYEKIRGEQNTRDAWFDKFKIDSITKYLSDESMTIDDMRIIQQENGIQCLIYNKKNEKVLFVHHEAYGAVINLK